MIKSICICGSGTMGTGIAQVFARNGFNTTLYDVDVAVVQRAEAKLHTTLESLVQKQKIPATAKDDTFRCLRFSTGIDDCHADLIIEAIIEEREAKTDLFRKLSAINPPEVILATNTSSLSVSSLQNTVTHAARFVGMHFFNPAPLMKLVEVTRASVTGDETVQTIVELCKQVGKIPVICKDAPGFIVNRVARQYYLEALRLVEQGIASVENVDEIMEATGFKMGPFRLMDLIGIDVNLSVSESLYKALGEPERLVPSSIQREKVKDGNLGRKAGEGFYKYNG